jgi:hypothetical protein
MHLKSIGAGIFSDLAIAFNATGLSPLPTITGVTATDAAAFAALFGQPATINATTGAITAPAAQDFIRIKNVREFPAMGTPPNIVNVPVYGQSQSQQIQGQADAPSMEITLNYVADDWKAGSALGALIGSGNSCVFRFALANSDPLSYSTKVASAGLGSVQNTLWYFQGKIESLLVTPNLTDANQATIAITLQSKLYGAYTFD